MRGITDPQAVAAALGLGSITTLDELRLAVMRGLPNSALEYAVQLIARSHAEAAFFIRCLAPQHRRTRTRTRLTIADGERIVRITHIAFFAAAVWQDEGMSREFLFSSPV